MCKFKSGIILKNKCVLSQEHEESHSNLLYGLKIEDTLENARRVFVRAELVPPDGNWWTDPDIWSFNVDQDILPDWYNEDPKRYEEEFREEVKSWVKTHIFVNQKKKELPEGYYYLKNCNIEKISGKSQVCMIGTIIGTVKDESVVFSMSEHSSIEKLCDNAIVIEAEDNSIIRKMTGSSKVGFLNMNSVVEEMGEYSSIGMMNDKSLVYNMREQSIVRNMNQESEVRSMYDQTQVIIMNGYSSINKMIDCSSVNDARDNSIILEMTDNSSIKYAFDNTIIEKMTGYSFISQLQDKAEVKEILGEAIVRKINFGTASTLLTANKTE